MTLPDAVSRWPVWYLALVAFVIYRGTSTYISVWRARDQWRLAIAQAPTKPERARLQGRRVGALTAATAVLLGAALLLFGSNLARVALALSFLVRARIKAAEFARGMAEGRKSVELASSVEYVAGRVEPHSLDWGAGILYVAVTQVLPAALLLVSTQLE